MTLKRLYYRRREKSSVYPYRSEVRHRYASPAVMSACHYYKDQLSIGYLNYHPLLTDVAEWIISNNFVGCYIPKDHHIGNFTLFNSGSTLFLLRPRQLLVCMPPNRIKI